MIPTVDIPAMLARAQQNLESAAAWEAVARDAMSFALDYHRSAVDLVTQAREAAEAVGR